MRFPSRKHSLASILLALCALGAASPAPAAGQRLVHTPPRIVPGHDLELSVQLPGEAGFTGDVYWRRKGEDYTRTTMVLHGDTLSAKIPARELEGGIEYYVAVVYGPALEHQLSYASAESPHVLEYPSAPPPVAVVAPPPPPEKSRTPVVGIAVMSTGAAAAVAAIVLGLQTKSAADDMASATSTADYQAKSDHANSLAKTTTAVWIAAGALGAIGAGLFALHF